MGTKTESPPAPKVAEGAPAKARRYLTEGRLTVRELYANAVVATCRGDGETYRLGYYGPDVTGNAGLWHCSCPARSDQCAHLRALRLVVDRPAQ
jgi:hypothetical protein